MSKYTPAPWHYLEGDKNFPPSVKRGNEGGFSVLGNSEHRAEADAKLIAASPDLFSALQTLVDDLEFRARIGQDDAKGVVACGNGAYLKAKSAIVKALTGK